MNQVLAENAKIKIGDTWYTVTVILTDVRGGKRVEYVAEDGSVVKQEKWSTSSYNPKKSK